MKTKINLFILLGFLLMALCYCSKKDNEHPLNPSLKSGQITYGLDVSLDSNTQSLSSLISSINDTSERKLDYYTFYLAVNRQQKVYQ
jgi:hypothetical protein